MTYSGGQRGKAKPRSERESPIQSLLNVMFPAGTGRPVMDRRTATQKYADAVAAEQMTPLERAPVGTPMILGGQLGYKGIKQSGEFKGAPTWIKRQDMESENIPTYDSSNKQYIYDSQPAVTPIVTGLTPTGEVDRTQSDEYKATRARYDQLRKAGPEMVMTPEGLREKAVDYGLQEWAKMYPQLAAQQEAAKYGTMNPLMQQTFGYQTGEAPNQVQRQMMIGGQRYDVDPEAIQYQVDQQRAAEMGSPNPLVQQENTANKTRYQAENATTAGMNRPVGDPVEPVGNRVENFLRRVPSKEITMFPTQPLF